MKNCLLFFKYFFRNKLLLISSILFFTLTVGKTLYSVFSCYQMGSEPLDYLLQTISLSIFSYVFFLFISNEFLYKIKQNQSEELIKVTKNGVNSYYICSFGVLLTLVCIYTIILLIINISIYFSLAINHWEYLWHVIANILMNISLISIIGILLGGILSLFKRRILSYVFMVLAVFISSPVFELLAEIVYSATGKSIYSIYDLFNIFPPLLQWAPLQSFGYSLLPYRTSQLTFWIFACFLILCIFILVKKNKKFWPILIIITIVSALSLGQYLQPSSKVTMSNSPINGATADAHYYSDLKTDTEQSYFNILKYDLDINIYRQLNVIAKLSLNQNNLNSYNFTLYHGYKISRITDKDGKELPFIQSGDYFTVNTLGKPLDEISIFYSGSSVKFFSNSQGISLPGWFAYYPRPGKIEVFNNSQQSFNRNYCPPDTQFQVSIQSKQMVYCNLAKSGNSFYGRTNGLTIIGGFYDSIEHNGIEVIYPYLATNEFTEKSVKSFVEQYLTDNIIKKEQKKIFIISNTNLISVYEKFGDFQDHIVINQFLGLPIIYEFQQIPEHKLSLYTAYSTYKDAPQTFDELVTFKKEEYNAMGENVDKDIYILLDKKLNELGAMYAEENIAAYLNDDNDLRDEYQFLIDLKK